MTLEIYVQCFIACLIGNIAHIAFKMYSLSQDYKKANMEFSSRQYMKDDKYALIADAICSLVLVYIVDEWVDNEYIIGKIKTGFILIGFTGSYVLMYFASAAKKKFRKVVDEKTDIADEKTNP